MGKLVGRIYLIHFDSPIAHARHYLGFSKKLVERIAAHREGTGARLLAVANERLVGYRVVRTWKGNQDLERKLKNRKNGPCLCPICNPRLLFKEGVENEYRDASEF